MGDTLEHVGNKLEVAIQRRLLLCNSPDIRLNCAQTAAQMITLARFTLAHCG